MLARLDHSEMGRLCLRLMRAATSSEMLTTKTHLKTEAGHCVHVTTMDSLQVLTITKSLSPHSNRLQEADV
jgi:hypothetical protein